MAQIPHDIKLPDQRSAHSPSIIANPKHNRKKKNCKNTFLVGPLQRATMYVARNSPDKRIKKVGEHTNKRQNEKERRQAMHTRPIGYMWIFRSSTIPSHVMSLTPFKPFLCLFLHNAWWSVLAPAAQFRNKLFVLLRDSRSPNSRRMWSLIIKARSE